MNYYVGFGIVVLFLGGYALDQRLQTGYTYAFSGLLLGVACLVYEIWKATRKK